MAPGPWGWSAWRTSPTACGASWSLELPSGGLFSKLLSVLPKLKELKAFAPKTGGKIRPPARRWCSAASRHPWTCCPSSPAGPRDAGALHHPAPGHHRRPGHRQAQTWACTACSASTPHTTGMHWHRHKGGGVPTFRRAKELGQKLPVAVGHGRGRPPSVYAACAPPARETCPSTCSAAFLLRRPVELVKGRHQRPAGARRGRGDHRGLRGTRPSLCAPRGPFGDHTGYYSLADDLPGLAHNRHHPSQGLYLPHHHRGHPAHGGTTTWVWPRSASSCPCLQTVLPRGG